MNIMINLLSASEKRKLARERRLRFVVVTLIAVFFVQCLSVALLFPSYYAITLSIGSLRQELELKKAQVSPGGVAIQDSLRAIKKESVLMTPTVASSTSEMISEILREKPRGIAVKGVAFIREAKSIAVQATGIADTRDELVYFQKRLMKDHPERTITYADSYITKKRDIDFTMTITIPVK